MKRIVYIADESCTGFAVQWLGGENLPFDFCELKGHLGRIHVRLPKSGVANVHEGWWLILDKDQKPVKAISPVQFEAQYRVVETPKKEAPKPEPVKTPAPVAKKTVTNGFKKKVAKKKTAS